jgi:hypothetical protein
VTGSNSLCCAKFEEVRSVPPIKWYRAVVFNLFCSRTPQM